MTIEKRLENLENLVNALSKKIDNNKYYTDADINGNRKSVSDITPYTESKTAYFGENYKTFYGVPNGNVSVFFDNYNGEYETSRIEDRLTVTFPERLTDMTSITVMVQ